MNKHLCFIVGMLMIAPLLTTTGAHPQASTPGSANSGAAPLTFFQVDFLYSESTVLNSNWGCLVVDINLFLEQVSREEGFLNIMTDKGWVVQNHFINKVAGHTKLAIEFALGNPVGTDVTSLSLYREFSAHPLVSFDDGPRDVFPVDDMIINAEGAGESWTTQMETPMSLLTFEANMPTFNYTKPLQPGENVQCAAGQCWPMAVANSLQYLENNYMNIIIPHDHIPGLKGDTSLVGQLDTYSDRNVVNRTEGGGRNNLQMIQGKFEYLDSIGMGSKIVHRHQGHHGGITPGDITHAGITSYDESVNGNVTFNWLYAQLKNCSDVEIGYFRDGGGGHAIRVIGCGKTMGQPWIRYIHDSMQTNSDPTDMYGLTEVQVYVTDLDGDGIMNVGSESREIGFALAETGKAIGTGTWTGGIGLAVDVINFGPLVIDDLPWSIAIQAPLMFFGEFSEGNIDLPPHETVQVKTMVPFGLGFADLRITAGELQVTRRGFVFGPFVIPLKET
ncbi:MAG: hypothetical protein JXA00_00710 [Candidatus Thermoplasmatota archaeon]|nr:hypothetical protein [Candidatus Thermoplasmatota archaeon]